VSIDIILPSILLLIAFLLKLSIDRSVDKHNILQAIFELPVDIMFLSLSFGVGYTISNSNHFNEGITFLFGGLCISILVVLLWRKCVSLFSIRNNYWLVAVLFSNIILSGTTIVYSVNMVKENKIKAEIKK